MQHRWTWPFVVFQPAWCFPSVFSGQPVLRCLNNVANCRDLRAHFWHIWMKRQDIVPPLMSCATSCPSAGRWTHMILQKYLREINPSAKQRRVSFRNVPSYIVSTPCETRTQMTSISCLVAENHSWTSKEFHIWGRLITSFFFSDKEPSLPLSCI